MENGQRRRQADPREWRGIFTIPQTPFDADDRVDMESLARSIDDRLAAGVSGILVPVVASEVGRLTTSERQAIVRAVIGQVPASLPVIVGCSSDDPLESRSMAEFATTQGAAGVLVQIPFRILRDELAVRAFLDTVCEVQLPMLMITMMTSVPRETKSPCAHSAARP